MPLALHDDGPDTALARALLAANAAPVGELRAVLDEVRELRAAGGSASLLSRLLERGVVSAQALDAAVSSLRDAPAAATDPGERRFGPYRVIRELARGGMGVVHEAVHEPTGVRRAVKSVLPVPGEELVEAVARFRREATALARLDHPNIVPIHEAHLDGPAPWLAEDLLPGGTLQDRVEAGPIPAREAVAVARKLAGALVHAHEHGLVHRDLKPGNVMFDAQGQPRVVDFGLASDLSVTTRLTASDMILGTPAYMAPEQARGEETDARSDVYALGAILHAMLAGKPPYSGRPMLVLAALLTGPPPALSRRDDLPLGLSEVVAQAMARDPAARYPTMAALEADLARVAMSETPEAALARRARRRARGVAGVLGALSAGLLLMLGVRLARARAWEAELAEGWARVESARTGQRATRLGLPGGTPGELTSALARLEALLDDPRARDEARASGRARLAQVRLLAAADVAFARGDLAALDSALAGLARSDPEADLLRGLVHLRGGNPVRARALLAGIPAPKEPLLEGELVLALARAELAAGAIGDAAREVARLRPAPDGSALARAQARTCALVEAMRLSEELAASPSAPRESILRLASLLESLSGRPPQGDVRLGRPFTTLCLLAAEQDPGPGVVSAVERALSAHLFPRSDSEDLPDATRLMGRALELVDEERLHESGLLAGWARMVDHGKDAPSVLVQVQDQLFRRQNPTLEVWLELNLDRARMGVAPWLRDEKWLVAVEERLARRTEWYARWLRAKTIQMLFRKGPGTAAGQEALRLAMELAISVAEDPLAVPQTRAMAEYTRGECAQHLGRSEEIEPAFARALELGHPAPDECWRAIGRDRVRRGELEQAALAAGEAIRWADLRYERAATHGALADPSVAPSDPHRPGRTFERPSSDNLTVTARLLALEVAALRGRAEELATLEAQLRPRDGDGSDGDELAVHRLILALRLGDGTEQLGKATDGVRSRAAMIVSQLPPALRAPYQPLLGRAGQDGQ